MKARLLRLAGLVAIGYVLWAMGLTAIQRSILFPRHAIPDVPDTSARYPGLVRLDVEHADGRSEGWFWPAPGARSAPVVFFAHGNAELIDFNAPFLRPYHALGVSIAMVEYRGYGRSDGDPSQEAITADLLAFREKVLARPEVDPGRVVYHGRSLGGGAVCALAATHPPTAMVLESTFRSVKVMARGFLLPGFLVADPFDNEATLARLDVPVLIFHGTRDELIPFEHAEVLAEVAPRARLIPLPCGHNDCPPDERAYWAAIKDHLAAAGVVR